MIVHILTTLLAALARVWTFERTVRAVRSVRYRLCRDQGLFAPSRAKLEVHAVAILSWFGLTSHKQRCDCAVRLAAVFGVSSLFLQRKVDDTLAGRSACPKGLRAPPHPCRSCPVLSCRRSSGLYVLTTLVVVFYLDVDRRHLLRGFSTDCQENGVKANAHVCCNSHVRCLMFEHV